MSLSKIIRRYTKSDIIPMHMPGHKRNTAMLGKILPWDADITEIPLVTDTYGEGRSYVASMEERAAKLFGFPRGKAYISTNGGTGAILAAIRAVTDEGEGVIMARNCHKSVYHAVELCRLQPWYIQPEVCPHSGISAPVTAQQVGDAFAAAPDAELVIITSPTYEGVLSDITAIAGVVHERGAILMVDAAHGAHLAIGQENPFRHADIVVHSLHKTLPALTQTAVLLENITRDHPDMPFATSMEYFNSSSPSYPLLASVDQCLHLLEEDGVELTGDYRQMIQAFRNHTKLKNLTLDTPFLADGGKIVISGRKKQISGTKLMKILRQDFGIELEMASTAYALAMTSICDTEEHFMALGMALTLIDGGMMDELYIPSRTFAPLPLPQVAMSAHQAVNRDLRSKGIASKYVYAYPPGIPLIVPGEVIPDGFDEHIRTLKEAGVRVIGEWE